MDITRIFQVEILILLLCCNKAYVKGCKFPYFLWQDNDKSEQKVWYTHINYISNSRVWESRFKIVISSDQFKTSSEIPWLCEEDDTPYQLSAGQIKRQPCVKSAAKSYTQCTSVEGTSKYRVLVTNVNNGKEKFMCMEFIQRNANAVEIVQSRPSDVDGVGLCSEDQLTRSQWPWIAKTLEHAVPCPMVGGFDFDAFINDRPKKLCHRVWRPSRLESECLLGEGVHFTFPEKTCSYFQDRPKSFELQCWSWWQQDNWIYVLASEKGHSPQYSLMLPSSNVDTITKAKVRFYFSPVFPTTKNGVPTEDIMHVELQLKRSAVENCYDESTDCEQFARDGKCTSDGFFYFGNYCKKSCGLCDLVPNTVPECNFPMNHQGNWVLFETNQKETVSIIGGIITFSKMGTFVCKSKHWEKPYYKLLSIYENGCRRRFTCIQLEYSEETGFLKLNLSPSNMVDLSFDLCNFRGDSVKILYAIPQISLFNCGLGGLVELQALMTGVDSCRGTLADWNPFTCNIVPTLTLSLRSCKGGMEIYREFTCEAHVNIDSNNKILLTKELTDSLYHPKYQCWLIKTHTTSVNSSMSAQWRRAYLLRRAQCGGDGDLDPDIYKPTEAIFQMYSEGAEKHCTGLHPTITYNVGRHAHRYNRGSNNPRTVAYKQHYDTFISNVAISLQHSTYTKLSWIVFYYTIVLVKKYLCINVYNYYPN